MDGKLPYIVGQMKILKVVGTDEANEAMKRMVKYFDETETDLARNSDSNNPKKISILLASIADDQKIKKMNAAQKAEYLRENAYVSQDPAAANEVDEIKPVASVELAGAGIAVDFNQIFRKEVFFFVLFMILATMVIKIFNL